MYSTALEIPQRRAKSSIRERIYCLAKLVNDRGMS